LSIYIWLDSRNPILRQQNTYPNTSMPQLILVFFIIVKQMELLTISLMQIGLETKINDIQLQGLCFAWVLMELLGCPRNNPQSFSLLLKLSIMQCSKGPKSPSYEDWWRILVLLMMNLFQYFVTTKAPLK
jgi:hypothetical protein